MEYIETKLYNLSIGNIFKQDIDSPFYMVIQKVRTIGPYEYVRYCNAVCLETGELASFSTKEAILHYPTITIKFEERNN